MPADSELYGVRPAKSTKAKEISSSTTLAFTSQLKSLLASSKDNNTSSGRPRPSKSKSDIFTSHNKNAKKRAAKDLEDDESSNNPRGKAWKQDLGAVDSNTLHRSKRALEEKARLYSAMRRGDYVASKGRLGDQHDQTALVDFDRKWAEKHLDLENPEDDESDDDSYDSQHESDNESVDYEDEFGRTRRLKKAEVGKLEKAKQNRLLGQEELDRVSLRPKAPENIIRGDTIQAAAFNPDEATTQKMEELAAKRDKSLTPPPETHYDATKEIRTKGVGFYQFSGTEEERKREMEALGKEREETERRRREKAEKVEKRKREIEERRRAVGEKRAKREADSFLEGLGEVIGGDGEKGG